MSLTTPQLLLIAPIIGGIGLSLISRWRRASAVIGTLFVIALILAMRISENEVLLVLERPFTLTDENYTLFTLMLAGMGLLFALSVWIPTKQAFAPLAIAAITPLAAAVMVQPLTYAPLFLLLAFAALTPIAQTNGYANNAPTRYLLLGVLAVPALLLVDWMGTQSLPTFSMTIVWLMLLTTAVLSAAFPFIGWVRPLVREMEGLTAVYLFSVAQLGITAVLFTFLHEQAWLLDESTFIAGLRWGGSITALLGGLTAIAPKSSSEKPSPKHMLGSLLLINMGVMAWAFTLPAGLGWETAVSIHTGRFIGLLLAGIGLHLMTTSRLQKLAMGLFAYGGFTLLGLPLTAGFIGQWKVLMVTEATWPLFIILLGIGTAVYGFSRHLYGTEWFTLEE